MRAEDLVPRVQRELRARKIYFGEIDGHATEETVTAIKNFQLSKGIDSSGFLDGDTLRALGFPDSAGDPEQVRLLEECNACVLHYLQAWQSGDWAREGEFFTDAVNYYDDQNVGRDFIRQVRAKEIARWPHRKSTLLNRIASLEPGHKDLAQVTARVRTEVAAGEGEAVVETEDLLFRLQKTDRGWQIAAVKLVKQLE